MPDADASACLCFLLLTPLAAAGLAVINTGLSRSRSAAHSMLLPLCAAAVAAIAFVACGFAFAGALNGPAHVFTASGKSWNWLGSGGVFLKGINASPPRDILTALLELFAISLASIIPAGAAAERWRLPAACLSTAVFAFWIYPLFVHWVWNGGWLAQLGANFGLGNGFVDPAGASCIHVVGAFTALAIAWIVKPRHGKFSAEGVPAAMPGHNAVLVLLGCMLALIGFLGLNSAGSILFASLSLIQSVLVDVNTLLCAAAAALTALFITRVRFGRPDASLIANGWVAGLVASSGVCAFIKPAGALLVGLIAGALVIFAVEIIELRMKVDDPAGAISVHGAGGLWGILAAGIFASASGQFVAQLVGISTLLGFMLPLAYTINWLIDRVIPQRVALEGERQGMDLFELGAGAYPEFVTHREDFTRR